LILPFVVNGDCHIFLHKNTHGLKDWIIAAIVSQTSVFLYNNYNGYFVNLQ